jgi:hypothetical protein
MRFKKVRQINFQKFKKLNIYVIESSAVEEEDYQVEDKSEE